ncbi:MAG TPA: sigma-54 dependent transcriptional regulator [Pyrinomonadaceae bacterium]|nr:sigma-54 dependent transcriptional regulator [Pyrinomonadaceae bacterium]
MGDSALLLDASGGVGGQAVALQTILEPYFTLKIVFQPALSQSVNTISLDSLADVNGFDPVVVFLFLPSELDQQASLLESIRARLSEIPIIAVIESCEPQRVFDLLRLGAADFITAPLRSEDVLPRTWRLMKRAQSEAGQARTAAIVQPDFALKQLVGASIEFVLQVKKIPLIAKCEVNVLIAGETGTGKEVYARAIHYSSPRSGKPFLPVNCGAIPLELVENELFGHERGAFTNASSLQPGLIEEASGGTLFLDEIDCLPLPAQVKLLRFLQDKEYRPLGSTRMRRANVRIIAASNLDLEEAVGNGTLRQDLYYRLNTISLVLPPLRERREDIPLLARHFIAKYSREFEKQVNSISPEALHRLAVHNWPGNVRELEHVIERAIVLCDGLVLQTEDVVLSSSPQDGRQDSLQEAKAKEIARFEKNYIQGVLCACSGNITRAAQVARKNRRAFWQLIQKHQIDVARFKSSVS